MDGIGCFAIYLLSLPIKSLPICITSEAIAWDQILKTEFPHKIFLRLVSLHQISVPALPADSFSVALLCMSLGLHICHSVTPSHCHYFTLSLSLCHSVTLSLCHSVILSLFDPVILSHCHFFTLSNCHSLSLSLSLIRPFFNSAILPVCKFTGPSVWSVGQSSSFSLPQSLNLS